jgi:hypothetical protein
VEVTGVCCEERTKHSNTVCVCVWGGGGDAELLVLNLEARVLTIDWPLNN